MGEKLVYHYCSNQKLISILEGKEIRLCDISKSNDYKELLMFYPEIFYKIEEAYLEEPFVFLYKNKEGIDAIRQLLRDIDELISQEINTGAITSFVTCFSGARDRLSQWRGYADNGRGGAIGFSVEALKAYAKKSKELQFVKIKYITKDGLIDIVETKAVELIQKWKKIREQGERVFSLLKDNDMKDLLLCILCYEDINSTIISSLVYKDVGFKEEEEYRLFTLRASLKFSDRDVLKKFENEYIRKQFEMSIVSEKLRFNITADNIIPYYPVSLTQISEKTIGEILLGPNNRIVLSDLRLLLDNNGWNVDEIQMKYSDISYKA